MSDTKRKGWLDRQLEDPEFRLEFSQELASQRFRDALQDALDSEGLTRADLADRMGRTRSAVTQVLRYGRNLTLNKMVELADACGYEFVPELRRRGRDVFATSVTSFGLRSWAKDDSPPPSGPAVFMTFAPPSNHYWYMVMSDENDVAALHSGPKAEPLAFEHITPLAG